MGTTDRSTQGAATPPPRLQRITRLPRAAKPRTDLGLLVELLDAGRRARRLISGIEIAHSQLAYVLHLLEEAVELAAKEGREDLVSIAIGIEDALCFAERHLERRASTAEAVMERLASLDGELSETSLMPQIEAELERHEGICSRLAEKVWRAREALTASQDFRAHAAAARQNRRRAA